MVTFRSSLVALLAAAALGLSACGSESEGPPPPSAEDRQTSEEFCAGPMGLDKYGNPDGFAACVDDVIPVVDCLEPSRSGIRPWVPRDCDNGGYNPGG
jgi:hypothetical protein